jgi:hypothetical protein
VGGRPSTAALAFVVASLLGSASLLSPAFSAPVARPLGTDIPPGHITSPQTWTAAGSPYRILGTIIIDPGVAVRAQPGTVISPLPGVRIFVEGALHLEGAAGSRIKVNTTGPAWEGIQYNATSLKSWWNHTDLSDAGTGLAMLGGNLELANVTISSSSIGVQARGGFLSLVDCSVTSQGAGIDSDRARLFANRITAAAGPGADATSTTNGTAGSIALLVSRAGVSGSAPGQTIIGNSTFTGGAGGANWFADRRAGDGGAAAAIRSSYSVSLVNVSVIGGRGGNNSGSASSYPMARAGDGGPAFVAEDSNLTTYFRGGTVRGGDGGPTSSPSPSRAGDGGPAVLVGPGRAYNTTVFNFDAYGGRGGDATGSGAHPGDGGPATQVLAGDDTLISSVRSIGGRGGDGAPLNGSGGRGGHGLHVVTAKRVFYYVVTLQGGRGGDTRVASAEPAGEGGDGMRLEYAETLFSELGYLIGGRGGDNHHASGFGGGRGGEGARMIDGKFRVEIGEADIAAGDGGDNYNSTNGKPGPGGPAAVNITAGTGMRVEFARIIPARGGKDFTGGPDGEAGIGYRISTGAQILVTSVDGIQGVTPVCGHVTNATAILSGNAYFRCKIGLLVDAPAGGKTPGVDSRAEYAYLTEKGAWFRSGATGNVVEMNVDNSTDVGIHVDQGSTVRFDLAEIHSSSTTNRSVLATAGAMPHFTNSVIRNSRLRDYEVSGDSHPVFLNVKHGYGKGTVADTSSLTVQNRVQFKAVDSRWSPMPRGFVEVKDNGTTVYAHQLFKGGGCGQGGTPCDDLMVDRVHRSSGMWENRTSFSVVYKTWTFTSVPGPIDNVNMSTSHFEWLVGAGIAPPRVNFTDPDDAATGVPPGSRIKIAFTAAMDRAAVESSIAVSAPNFGDFKWSTDNKTVDFAVFPWLMPDTTYTVVLNASVAKDTLGYSLDGNRDGEAQGSPLDDFSFSFTTGPRPTLYVNGTGAAPGNVSQGEAWVPFLIADYIASGAPALADTVEIQMYGDATESDVRDVSLWRDANGNARWDLNDKALGYAKFVLKKAKFNTTTAVDPKKPEHFFAVLNISQDALIDTYVGLQIASEAAVGATGADVAMGVKPLRSGLARIIGDLLPPKVVAHVPSKGAEVPVDSSISIQFSEPMNWTATRASFVLSPGVPLNYTISGNTVIVKPLQLLEAGTNYTFKVSGSAARDRAGNLLDGNGNGISEGSPNDDFVIPFRTAVPSEAILRGIVSDDLGAAVAGASVDLRVTGTNTSRNAATNSTGFFEIRVPVAGTVSAEVSVAKSGYVPQTTPGVLVRGGQAVWRNLTLPEDVGSIKVTVLDPGGAPAAGATITLSGPSQNRAGLTDSAGQALFTRVRAGNYTVRALKSGFGEENSKVDVKYKTTSEVTLKFKAPGDPGLGLAIGAGLAVALAGVVIAYLFLRRRGAKKSLPELGKKAGAAATDEGTEPKSKAAARAAAARVTDGKDAGAPK